MRPKNFSREEVLEKAMPVFWKHEFAVTCLQDLERATGVNKSGCGAKVEIRQIHVAASQDMHGKHVPASR
jgi:hypothetical protein